MRIPAIQAFNRTNYTNRNVNSSAQNVAPGLLHRNSVTGDSFVRVSKPLAFQGVEKNALVMLKQIPLEERLASVFSIMKQGDVLLAGPEFKEFYEPLKAVSKKFEQVLKRFFLVQDDNLKTPLAFYKDTRGEFQLMNLSKTPITLKDNGSGKSAPLLQYDSFFVVNNDVVTAGDVTFPIRDFPNVDISGFRKHFAKIYDCSDAVKDTISAQNTKTILKMLKPDKVKGRHYTFADIGGQDKALDMLKKEIIFPIRYPEAYANTSLNKGFIMYGPPGTGKTLTAEALANETNAYFIKLNGLEMESKWVGESEENWRVLFDTARVNQPAVIFIDEFDAVAKKRGGVDVYGDKVVNQLLTLMSDVEKNGDDIYVIAATNRPEMLDSAITRSGRFGRSIEMKAPETVEDMINIFNIHTKGRKLDGKLDSKNLSERLLKAKATGADVAYVANKANEKALQRCGIYEKMENGTFSAKDMDSFSISNEDFIAAIDEFSKGRQKTERKPIGFVQYPAKHGATA